MRPHECSDCGGVISFGLSHECDLRALVRREVERVWTLAATSAPHLHGRQLQDWQRACILGTSKAFADYDAKWRAESDWNGVTVPIEAVRQLWWESCTCQFLLNSGARRDPECPLHGDEAYRRWREAQHVVDKRGVS